jgi:cytochrome c
LRRSSPSPPSGSEPVTHSRRFRTAITPTGADLFKQQCATCHSLNAADPPRQGPVLAGVYGRKPGSLAGFRYSSGYAATDFVWDEEHLDTYLANPQALIPGAIMLYKQKKFAKPSSLF